MDTDGTDEMNETNGIKVVQITIVQTIEIIIDATDEEMVEIGDLEIMDEDRITDETVTVSQRNNKKY